MKSLNFRVEPDCHSPVEQVRASRLMREPSGEQPAVPEPMMSIRCWSTGEEVRLGDTGAFSRTLRRTQRGIVTYVFNPAASVEREVNEYGVIVALENSSRVWFGAVPK